MKKSIHDIKKEFLLFTNYDSRKTLTENIEIINEQEEGSGIPTYEPRSVRNTNLRANDEGEYDPNGEYTVKIVRTPSGQDISLIFDTNNQPKGYYRGSNTANPSISENVKNTLNYIFGWFNQCKPKDVLGRSWSNQVQAKFQRLSSDLTDILDEGPKSGVFDTDALIGFLGNFGNFDELCLFNHFYGTLNNNSKFLSQLSDFFYRNPGDKKLKEILNIIARLASEQTTDSGGGTTPGGGGTTPGGGSGYVRCDGPIYKFGCISPAISKVQACAGLTQDDKFGSETLNYVRRTLGKDEFDINTDMDKLCRGGTPITPPPGVVDVFTDR